MRIDGAIPRPLPLAARPALRGSASPARATGPSPAAVPRAAGPAVLTSLNAVLAAQQLDAVEPVGERRRRAIRRGERLLDLLDELRRGLLDGHVPAGLCARLRRLLEERVEGLEDPELARVLAEVELRAAVEAAKLERALEPEPAP